MCRVVDEEAAALADTPSKPTREEAGARRCFDANGYVVDEEERLRHASPAKDGDDGHAIMELLEDSDKEDGGPPEEEEAEEAYEALDEGERTAAQVLDEANALSAQILRVVAGWCRAGAGERERTA